MSWGAGPVPLPQVSSAAGDPSVDRASGVLRNLLGITDAAELARARRRCPHRADRPGRPVLSGRLGFVADPYHGLAADYDWIFDDGALAGGVAVSRPATARLLQRIGPASDVLDAACGTGIDAAVLARRGFNVRAADGSQAMVQVAAARFRREGLAIRVQRCLWADLPAVIGERFDVVLCTGNALVHAADRDAMV